MKQLKSTRRGFTLLELIIVIGIIGILSAVFVPAISGYLTRSRLNTSNADAKVIFNSMQTICQELEFAERSSDTTVFYGPKKPDTTVTSLATLGNVELDVENSEIMFYVINGSVQKVWIEPRYDHDSGSTSDIMKADNVNGNLQGPGATNKWQIITGLDNPSTTTQPMQRMDRLFPDNRECSYMIKIGGYQVEGVFCAQTPDSVYLGGFPLKAEDRGGFTPKTAGDSDAPFNTDTEWTLSDISGEDTLFTFYKALDKYVNSAS